MIPAKLAAIDGSREASRAWTPSFIAATEPLPAALTVKRYACGFFSFFSCPYKKRTRFSPFQRRRNVLFSLRRKAPKDSLRLSPQTPSICWQAHTHGSKGVAVLAQLAQATTRRAGRNYEWKARARRRKAAGAHSLSVRRVPPWIARVYECKHVSLPCIF